MLLAQYRANVGNIRPPLTQTGSYCESSTLLRKQTFSLRRSHIIKESTKYGEIFNLIFSILTFMAISSKSMV